MNISREVEDGDLSISEVFKRFSPYISPKYKSKKTRKCTKTVSRDLSESFDQPTYGIISKPININNDSNLSEYSSIEADLPSQCGSPGDTFDTSLTSSYLISPEKFDTFLTSERLFLMSESPPIYQYSETLTPYTLPVKPFQLQNSESLNFQFDSAVTHNNNPVTPIKEVQPTTVSSMYGFIDVHCHIDLLFKRIKYNGTFQEYCNDTEDKFPANFEGCIAVFCHPNLFSQQCTWKALLNESNIWGAFGCHPHYADKFDFRSEVQLAHSIRHEKVLAVGEIGLDYSKNNNVTKEIQKIAFQTQIRHALEIKKPIMIHCRDAHIDCLKILEQLVPNNYLIHRHCFTGDIEEANMWINTFPNLYFSFTCLVTHYNKFTVKKLRDAINHIPLNRIMLETDAPYFRPHSLPNSGDGVSNPGMAIYVANEIAFIKKIPLDDVLIAVRKNTKAFYNI